MLLLSVKFGAETTQMPQFMTPIKKNPFWEETCPIFSH